MHAFAGGRPPDVNKERGAGCLFPIDRPSPVPFCDGRADRCSRPTMWLSYLGAPLGKLLWTLYRAPDDVRYRHFEIPKRSGGMRQIHAPIGLVRELQDRLHVDLKQLYRAHPNAHGFIDGRSIASNAADHTAKRWVLNIDLEDFFPTINFGRIRGLLMRPPFELGPAAAAVCAQIVTLSQRPAAGCSDLARAVQLHRRHPRPAPAAAGARPQAHLLALRRRHHLLDGPAAVSRRALPCTSRSKAAASGSRPARRWSRRSGPAASPSTPRRCASRAAACTRA